MHSVFQHTWQPEAQAIVHGPLSPTRLYFPTVLEDILRRGQLPCTVDPGCEGDNDGIRDVAALATDRTNHCGRTRVDREVGLETGLVGTSDVEYSVVVPFEGLKQPLRDVDPDRGHRAMNHGLDGHLW